MFGMGPRRPSLIYSGGTLRHAQTGEVVRVWNSIARETFKPQEYEVALLMDDGTSAAVRENGSGLWLDERGAVTCLSDAPVPALPRFAGHPHAPLLRALHGELLTNFAEAAHGGGPLPNRLVYDTPWLRDAAMVAFCLERTGNLTLLSDFVADLARWEEPFDRNNGGHREPDNLGQVLTILALTGETAAHPLARKAIAAAETCRQGDHIAGLSDFAPHPVYQTKWLKYGLRRIGLDDSRWHIPAVYDSYSALFWMDYKNEHVSGTGFSERDKTLYPYLGWAEAHFHGALPKVIPTADDSPLTWEAEASQANYAGMVAASPALAAARTYAPHTWHAAKMFLALLDLT